MIVLSGRKGAVTHLALGPGGRVLAAGGHRGLELWDLPSGDKWPPPTDVYYGGRATFHPTQPVCFAASGIGVAEIETDTRKASLFGTQEKAINWLTARGMTVDGSGFVCFCNVSRDTSGDLRLLRWRRGKPLRQVWVAEVGGLTPRASRGLSPQVIRVFPDGKTFLTLDAKAGQGGWTQVVEMVRVAVRSVKNGELLRWARLPAATTTALAISPDGGRFVTCQANTLSVWNADDLEVEPRRLKNDSRSRFTGVAFHPSGKYLAAGNDATVKLYDTTNWQVAKTYTWAIGKMRSVAFSPDGTLAAAGSDSSKVVVWDVDV